MLTDHERDTLATLLTPRLVRALFETGHFSSSEFYDFNKVTALKFMSRYREGLAPFLASHPDAERVWALLNANIPPDKRFNSKDRFIRDERLKDMQSFCALQADPQGMALLNSLPIPIQPTINEFLNAASHFDDQCTYYLMYQDIIKVMAALKPQQTAGDTPLMFMAMKGHTRVAKSLLVAGANTSIKDKGACHVKPSVSARFEVVSACEGYTALELAIKYKHVDMQALLIDYGSDINMTHSAFHPAHEAIRQGNKSTLDLLISKNVDLSVTNMVQETPLLFSARIKDKKPDGPAIFKSLSRRLEAPSPSTSSHSIGIAIAISGVMLAISLGISFSHTSPLWILLVVACLPVTAMAVNLARMKM